LGFTPQPHVALTRGAHPSHSPVENFKCSNKHDPPLLKPIKDGKQFDSQQHSTVAQAHAQDDVVVLHTNHIPSTQNEDYHFQEKQTLIASDSPPSEDSAVHVPDKVDAMFGDASYNLLASAITAPVDLDQAQICEQSAFQKPFQVPLVLLFPGMPVDNCGKLPPEVHEVPDQLDNSSKSVIFTNAKKTTFSDVTSTFEIQEASTPDHSLFHLLLSGDCTKGDLILTLSETLSDAAPSKNCGSSKQALAHTDNHPKLADSLVNIHHVLSNTLAGICSNTKAKLFSIPVLTSAGKAMEYGKAGYQACQHTVYSTLASMQSSIHSLFDCRVLSDELDSSDVCTVKIQCIFGIQCIIDIQRLNITSDGQIDSRGLAPTRLSFQLNRDTKHGVAVMPVYKGKDSIMLDNDNTFHR